MGERWGFGSHPAIKLDKLGHIARALCCWLLGVELPFHASRFGTFRRFGRALASRGGILAGLRGLREGLAGWEVILGGPGHKPDRPFRSFFITSLFIEPPGFSFARRHTQAGAESTQGGGPWGAVVGQMGPSWGDLLLKKAQKAHGWAKGTGRRTAEQSRKQPPNRRRVEEKPAFGAGQKQPVWETVGLGGRVFMACVGPIKHPPQGAHSACN